jgi:hypothetical protein
MSAAIQEAQARLNSSLKDIVTFFAEGANVSSPSIDILNDYIEKHLSFEFLLLAESYGRSMAFINHDELVNLLFASWNLLFDGYTLERKITMKRIRMLKEDKKSDPAVLARQEQLLIDIESKKAKALVECMRLKAMRLFPIKNFAKENNFDYVTEYGRVIKKEVEERALLAEGKESLIKEKDLVRDKKGKSSSK